MSISVKYFEQIIVSKIVFLKYILSYQRVNTRMV